MTRTALVALALALLPALAAAQSTGETAQPMVPVLVPGAELQGLVDAAPEGSVVHVPAGKYGPVRISKPLTLLGAPDHASVVTRPQAGTATTREAAIVVASRGVVLEGLAIADAPLGVRLAPDAQAELVGLAFRNVTLPALVEDGALALVADAREPIRAEARGSGRAFHGHVVQLRVVDNATREPVANASITLQSADGAFLAEWRADPAGSARAFAPLSATRAPPAGLAGPAPQEPVRALLAIEAEGYAVTRFAAASLSPGAVNAVQLDALAEPAPDPIDAALDAWRSASPAARAAVVAGASTAAIGAGAAAAMRSENRLWRFLLALLPLYTRLARSKLLDQPTRERVFAFVKERPGSHYREIRRALDLPNGALAHHLAILVRERYVREEKHGMYRRFYPVGVEVVAPRPVDTAERVLAFVRANPGATGSAVAKALATTPSLVAYHLDRLEASGRLARAREGREVRLYPLDATSAFDR